jgi:hypothetical protein
VPQAPLDTATMTSAPSFAGTRAKRMCAPLSPSIGSSQYLNETFSLPVAAVGAGAAATESARAAIVAESRTASNVPLSVRTERTTARPVTRSKVNRAVGVVTVIQ